MHNGVQKNNFSQAENLNNNDKNDDETKIDDCSEYPRFRKTRGMLEYSASNSLVSHFGKNERKVLVIYTGGTIGMMSKEDGCKCIFYFLNTTVVMTSAYIFLSVNEGGVIVNLYVQITNYGKGKYCQNL